MGSDATEKSHRRGILRRLYYLPRTTQSVLCLVLFSLLFLLVNHLAKDDFELSHTFSPQDLTHVPDRCMDLATRFHHCQENTEKKPVVLACHRKWCHSYGHCEPCAGVGDRTLHMLSLVQEALQRCIPVQLDYPLTGIQLVSDAVYHDPIYGPLLGNLLHRRSYDVTPRTVDTSTWGDEPAFVHFTPDHYAYIPYDMCLFHILFRPIPALQQEIDYHRQQMGPNVIGIHFRSGDAASFGYDNKDVRSTDISDSFSKMLACGERLAEKLFSPGEHYTFFLATDNAKAKALAREVDDSRYTVYQTDIRPALYVSLDAERDAWMEVFLLSMMQGLVVNVRPRNYEGKAGRLSMFSVLSKRIGFIEDEAIMECHLD
jgi:hypothetical protein